MRDDYPPLTVDIPELYESIIRDAGRQLSLDEWGYIVAALRAGAMVRIKDGEIEFQFRHE